MLGSIVETSGEDNTPKRLILIRIKKDGGCSDIGRLTSGSDKNRLTGRPDHASVDLVFGMGNKVCKLIPY